MCYLGSEGGTGSIQSVIALVVQSLPRTALQEGWINEEVLATNRKHGNLTNFSHESSAECRLADNLPVFIIKLTCLDTCDKRYTAKRPTNIHDHKQHNMAPSGESVLKVLNR